MPIERFATNTDHLAGSQANRDACLGCPDCKGPCWSAAELLLIPEMILQTRRTHHA